MLFSALSEYFEKLEKTSSRLQLIDILASLFKLAKDGEEAEKICYLVQGRIAPFFEAIEIGMAEKTVASAVALAFNLDKEEVLIEFDHLGDMGLAVERLANSRHSGKPKAHLFEPEPQSRRPESPSALRDAGPVFDEARQASMTIAYVFNVLTEIANTSGDGTVEKRINLLSSLLKKLDTVSCKYLSRIPLGNLRLGIGDPTILDALAKVKLGDKSQRHYLEGAYNRTSDLGLIAKTIWPAKNAVLAVELVEKLHVTVGKPIRSMLCERLPTPEKTIEKMGEIDVQFKFDGFRVQLHKNGDKISMFSRNLENMTHMFPEFITAAKKQIKAHSVILDTEALAYNPVSEEFLPFQETTKRRRKHNIKETALKLPLKAFVFDILFLDGKSLLDTPLNERLEIMKKTLDFIEDDILIPTKNNVVKDAKELQALLDDSITKGLEGLVVKKLNSFYEAGGRNFNWVKLKRHSAGELKDTIDCVILGYIIGKGKRTVFGAGALLVGIYDPKKDVFVTVSKIGTGLTDEEWISIKQRTKGLERKDKPARVDSFITPSVWVEPKLVIEVLADEITRSPLHTAGMDIKDKGLMMKNELGYALRFPRLVSFRDKDKKAEDATTVKELIEMYNEQGAK